MHQVIEPKIHDDGTPVMLVSSLNEDGTTHLAPNPPVANGIASTRCAGGR